MNRRKRWWLFALVLAIVIGAGVKLLWYPTDCAKVLAEGFLPVAMDRVHRFLGKVQPDTAGCRGGRDAVGFLNTPWVDWQNYWGAADTKSQGRADQNRIGVTGALTDLEYQRIELIRFNLFDNNGTYRQYVRGRDGQPGASLKVWPEMRLPKTHANFMDVGGDGDQLCRGDLIRARTLTGICNDMRNPLMGSTHQLFGRLVELDATFPDLGKTDLARNRHAGRLELLKPDPQLISRKLFSRAQAHPEKCRNGLGLDGDSADAGCDYQKANTFNVLAAFWIQFMTHDWFSHLDEGHNAPELMKTGCQSVSAAEAATLECRPGDVMDRALIAEGSDPSTFTDSSGKTYLDRAFKTTRNNVTAWWDASQMYGYDETSRRRVKRDPKDPAKLLLNPESGPDTIGYLPLLGPRDPGNPAWAGQEATAFADNWNIGLSFFHNVFAREHNAFITAFRKQAALTPGADSGLRNPRRPDRPILYRDVTADELFEVARLVVAAEIAKIHTIEWTTQLLYDEPLYRAMNANWSGLFGKEPELSAVVRTIAAKLGASNRVAEADQWYSVFASGAGIFGQGSTAAQWNLATLTGVNDGTNHFGSPFNFPEEFPTVYRLHPLVPDLIEFRDLRSDPNQIRKKIPVANTFRGPATLHMHSGGIANWALSMGRQRVGALTLHNHPLFLQNLPMPRLHAGTDLVDVPALDILRDRERGVPRFNEFRRQLGLRQLTGFDDFANVHAAPGSAERTAQDAMARGLREVYGQHRCDASKRITGAQLNPDGSAIDDCLGRANGSMVDNIEDVDTVVGWLAESTRPHGFAISETQFQVFILNASRRLFSDRFFTSSFRPEFYTSLGVRWVNDNGPDGKVMEKGAPNGHIQEVLPLKRVLLRAIPELAPELESVINSFDPWARDRGDYYSAEWKPRRGAESDPAFR
ncbi:MAG TPA: peroxidase family protein [Bryobacteraceae bacterium]|nr:peroxidase family protein [Bryobacteraceae bacterium]